MTPFDPLALTLAAGNLIEASAGTGKTYTISTLYLRLLLEERLNVAEILVVTYTRAATAELRERIRNRIRLTVDVLRGEREIEPGTDLLIDARLAADGLDEDILRLNLALAGFDEAAIFTIHGFCQRVLRDNAFESGAPFEAELLTSQAALVDEVARDYWALKLYAAPPSLVQRTLDQNFTPKHLTSLAHRAVGDPSMPILPADFRPGSDDGLDQSIAQARTDAGEIWQRDRRAILDILTGDSLNKGSYKPDKIRDSWAPDLDEYFASTGSDFPEFLPKLSSTAVQDKTKKGKTTDAHAFFDACQVLADRVEEQREVLDEQILSFQLELTAFARSELTRRKAERDAESYDDLLHRLRAAMTGPFRRELATRIRNRFRAALIDEFQDTDPAQFDIFRNIWTEPDDPLFLIGDPKQAIYGFRGADLFAYIRAVESDRLTRTTLGINYRSDPLLIQGVNTIFSRAKRPFVFEQIAFEPVAAHPDATNRLGGSLADRAPLEIIFVDRTVAGDSGKPLTKGWADGALSDGVAGEIAWLLNGEATIDDRAIEPADVAVLTRTNRQALQVQKSLRAVGVPAVLLGDSSVFETAEAAELERLLQCLANPVDTSLLRAALTTSILGIDANQLTQLESDDELWNGWLRRVRDWHELWRNRGFVQAFRAVLSDQNVEARLLAHRDGERRLTNLFHLGELLQTAASQAHLGPHSLLRWFGQMRLDVDSRPGVVGETAQIRLESDSRAVKLVTIHKSKGLQYPIVYCPFLWDGVLLRTDDKTWVRFHDENDGDRLKLDIGSNEKSDHLDRAEEEALAEGIRVAYVALTRACHRLTIIWGGFNKAETSPLAYLLHQSPETDVSPSDSLPTVRYKSLDDDELRNDLDELVAASDGAIEVNRFAPPATGSYRAATASSTTLSCRQLSRRIQQGWRTSSFSGLTREEPKQRHKAIAPDHDQSTGETEPGDTVPATGPDVTLATFPAGPEPGTLLHYILEHLSFTETGDLLASATSALGRFRMSTDLAPMLVSGLEEILATTLDDSGLRLGAINRQRRLDEMEFLLPVAGADETWLTPERLGAVFEEHASPRPAPHYVDRIRGLNFQAIAGYLRGFIDLIFEHDGRYYVVDYKSNHLGDKAAHYQTPSMVATMSHHHYFLQYHLYLLALDRHLSQRLADYDYDTHIGGVYYLFLRGMSPDHAPGSGIFFDRPSRELVRDLGDLFLPKGATV